MFNVIALNFLKRADHELTFRLSAPDSDHLAIIEFFPFNRFLILSKSFSIGTGGREATITEKAFWTQSDVSAIL
jgi:hypothetical protein